MRRTHILIWPVLAVLVFAAAARAAPGDPYVVYTANNYADGAVILRTDPATSSLVEISRNGPQGSLFQRPFDLAVEADGNLVVADMGAPNQKDGSVIRVDPLTGRQTLLSSGGLFFDPAGIAVAPNGDIYVVDNLAPDNNGGVIRVDPRTGAQTMVSHNGQGGSLFDLPFGIAIDRDGSLVVSNRVSAGGVPLQCLPSGRVIRVNPANGAQSLISQSVLPFNLFIGWPLGVAIDANGSIVLANECPGPGGLVRVNPLNGVQSVITSNGAQDILRTPERIAFDPGGGLLVSDFGLGGDGDGGIARVDPATGAQTEMRSGDLFNHPLGIAAVVNRPPSAALSLHPALVAAGRPVRLDGSGSRDPDGLRLVYEWDLNGDGTFEAGSGTTPTATHTFNMDGRATLRMRVNDPHGGRAVATAVLTVDGSTPVLSRLRAGTELLGVAPARRKRHRGSPARRRPPGATSLRFQVSEPATISVVVERPQAGRRKAHGACRPRAKRGRRCTSWSRARLITRAARAGSNAITLRARGLRPGRYRLAVTAIDRVGHRSVRRYLPLQIVRLPG